MAPENENLGTTASDVVGSIATETPSTAEALVNRLVNAKLAEFGESFSHAIANLDSRLDRLEGAEISDGESVSERVERLEHVANKWNSGDLQEFDKQRAAERERADKSI